MKLSTWIEKNGGTGKTGVLLGVKSNNVYAWQQGNALPRPRLLKLINQKSRGRVAIAEIVDEYLAKLDARKRSEASKKGAKKKKTAASKRVAISVRAIKKIVSKKKSTKKPLGF